VYNIDGLSKIDGERFWFCRQFRELRGFPSFLWGAPTQSLVYYRCKRAQSMPKEW
jgi:hypothetical protein